MTPAEKLKLGTGKLHHEVTKNIFYADDTIIMTSSAQASHLLPQKVQQKYKKYGMKLNQNKCEHIIHSAIHRIQFESGEEVPTTQTVAYLGSRVHYAWLTVMKLDLFWRKAPATLKWKPRVLDAAIHPKVYGMETLVIPQSDYDQIDAFQVRIFRKILNTKHPYWSHVTNDTVMNIANTRAQIYKNIEITPLSFKLKQRIIKFYGHTIRRDCNTDQMRAISIDEDGNRISAPKPWRSGRPKLKWYDIAKPLVIQLLENINILLNTWRTDFSQNEVNQYIIKAAEDREF